MLAPYLDLSIAVLLIEFKIVISKILMRIDCVTFLVAVAQHSTPTIDGDRKIPNRSDADRRQTKGAVAHVLHLLLLLPPLIVKGHIGLLSVLRHSTTR